MNALARLQAVTARSRDCITQPFPRYGEKVVDVVTGRLLTWLELVGDSSSPHHMSARLRTANGDYWVKRIRQIRRPMPGELRAALSARTAPAATGEG